MEARAAKRGEYPVRTVRTSAHRSPSFARVVRDAGLKPASYDRIMPRLGLAAGTPGRASGWASCRVLGLGLGVAACTIACGGLEGPTGTLGTDDPAHVTMPPPMVIGEGDAEPVEDAETDAAPEPDAEPAVDADPDPDASPVDAEPVDAEPTDGGTDAAPDAGDASPDPGSDASLDAPDDRVSPGPVPPGERECGKPTSAALLFTARGTLRTFDVDTLAIGPAVTVACDVMGLANSLGVDATGTAFMAFQNGTLELVSTKTGACARSAYANSPSSSFSTHLIHNSGVWGETLYVSNNDGQPANLYYVDQNWTPQLIGPMGQGLENVELSGDDQGNAYALDMTAGTARIFALNKTTGAATNSPYVTGIPFASSWSFVVIGETFYLFVGNAAWKYQPGGMPVLLTRFDEGIVGASLFGCAP
jgi:hypothetical protein